MLEKSKASERFGHAVYEHMAVLGLLISWLLKWSSQTSQQDQSNQIQSRIVGAQEYKTINGDFARIHQ